MCLYEYAANNQIVNMNNQVHDQGRYTEDVLELVFLGQFRESHQPLCYGHYQSLDRPLSFCDEQVDFQSLLLMSAGELCFCFFVLIFLKQGQNDAAKIGTGDSGVYQ